MNQPTPVKSKPKPSFMRSMRAVLWGFLGVRKADGHEEDMASLSLVHVIIAGVIGVVIFMVVLLLIVRAVVSSSVSG